MLGLSTGLEILESLKRRLQHSVDNLQHVPKGGTDSDLIGEEAEYSISDDDDDEDYDDDVHFYIDLLMNLVPSMEQVYSQAVYEKEVNELNVSSPTLLWVDAKTSQDSAGIPLATSDRTFVARIPHTALSTASGITSGTISGMTFDDATCKDLRNGFEGMMREIPKEQKKKLWPKVPKPPADLSGDQFQRILLHLSQTPLRYENSALKDEALSLVPLDRIYEEADDEFQLQQAMVASLGSDRKSHWGHQDCVMRALLRYV